MRKSILYLFITIIVLTGCASKTESVPEESALEMPATALETPSHSIPDSTDIPILIEPDESETDSFGVYTGELERYVRDKTGEMMNSDMKAEEYEVEEVCTEFSKTMFTFHTGMKDFSKYLKEFTHDQFRKADSLENICPIYDKVHMESDFKKMLPHSSMFFYDDANNLYCKYIASVVYTCKMDYLEEGDYVNVVEFDLVKIDHEWLLLNYRLHFTCPYDDDYSVSFTPGTNGTRLDISPHNPVFSWTFDDIDAFLYRMKGANTEPPKEGDVDVYNVLDS